MNFYERSYCPGVAHEVRDPLREQAGSSRFKCFSTPCIRICRWTISTRFSVISNFWNKYQKRRILDIEKGLSDFSSKSKTRCKGLTYFKTFSSKNYSKNQIFPFKLPKFDFIRICLQTLFTTNTTLHLHSRMDEAKNKNFRVVGIGFLRYS